MNKTKWIFYTVIIGLIPIMLRALTYLIVIDNEKFHIIYSSDIIFFGFVLCISNINELELLKVENDWLKWVTTVNSLSIVGLTLYSFFLGMIAFDDFIPGEINKDAVRIASTLITMGVITLTIIAYTKLKNHTYE